MNVDFFELLDKTLQPKLQNTFMNNFINEVKDCLQRNRSYDLFKALPKSTYLHLTGFSNNFLECMAFNEKKIYYVPKENIVRKKPRNWRGFKNNTRQ